jgi:hypothetical protein
MTTREGSRASRDGARDAGSFGTAVSSALPTVYLFRPCPPPAVGALGEPLDSNEREMSERRHRAAFEHAHAPVAATAPAAPRTGRGWYVERPIEQVCVAGLFEQIPA